VCGGPQGTCFLDDTCNTSGVCQDNGFVSSGCNIQLTGMVTDFDGVPFVGLPVQVLSGAPPQTTTTGADGSFALTVEVGVDIFVHIQSPGTHWGNVLHYRGDPTSTSLGNVALIDDARATTLLTVNGLDPVSTSLGLLQVNMSGVSVAGGESVDITPTCTQASCGPVQFGSTGVPFVSNTRPAGGRNLFVYLNLPASDHAITVTGAPGVNACDLRYDLPSWPVLAHTATLVLADCAPL
jgi:hypothetical protein